MAALQWVAPTIGILNTAILRAWLQDFHSHMLSAGFEQAADTGQLDIGSLTAPVPAGTTWSGLNWFAPLIYLMKDSLYSTYPLVVRVQVGWQGHANGGSTRAIPILSLQLGTGTNGSGTLTGAIASTGRYYSVGAAASSSELPGVTWVGTQSFISFDKVNGFAGVVYSPTRFDGDSGSNRVRAFAPISFFIKRVPSIDGGPLDSVMFSSPNIVMAMSASGYPDVFTWLRTTGTMNAYYSGGFPGRQNNFPFFGGPHSVGGVMQIQKGYTATNRARLNEHMCMYPAFAVSGGTQFQATLEGVSPKNFVCLPLETGMVPFLPNIASNEMWGFAMIFEDD